MKMKHTECADMDDLDHPAPRRSFISHPFAYTVEPRYLDFGYLE